MENHSRFYRWNSPCLDLRATHVARLMMVLIKEEEKNCRISGYAKPIIVRGPCVARAHVQPKRRSVIGRPYSIRQKTDASFSHARSPGRRLCRTCLAQEREEPSSPGFDRDKRGCLRPGFGFFLAGSGRTGSPGFWSPAQLFFG